MVHNFNVFLRGGGGGGAAPGYPTVQAASVDNLFTKCVIDLEAKMYVFLKAKSSVFL